MQIFAYHWLQHKQQEQCRRERVLSQGWPDQRNARQKSKSSALVLQFTSESLFQRETEMDDEHLQLAKRHSFPYMQVYTWNILKSRSPNEVEIQSAKADKPVINSDGTSEEREARLEAAILWIRKELVRIKFIRQRNSNFKHGLEIIFHGVNFLFSRSIVVSE